MSIFYYTTWVFTLIPEEHITTKDSAFHKKRPPKNMKTEMGRPRAKIFFTNFLEFFEMIPHKDSQNLKFPSNTPNGSKIIQQNQFKIQI